METLCPVRGWKGCVTTRESKLLWDDDAVWRDRRDAQRALFPTPRFIDPGSANRLRAVRAVTQLRRQLGEIAVQVPFIHRDGHVVDARRARVGVDTVPRRLQRAFGIDLVHQAEPDASFHALFERRQHAFRPHTRFRPRPTGADLSCLCSLRHCRRWRFRVCGRHALHLPGSLCSTPITGASSLVRTLCLLSGRLFGSSQSMNTGLHPIGQVSLRHAHIPCGHSVANHLMALRRRFCALPFSAAHARSHPCRTSPLTRQARRTHPAESRSSSYGLVHHLRLLPTPPRGGAVIVSFRPESVCLERTCTSLDVCAWRRTGPACVAGRLTLPVWLGASPFLCASVFGRCLNILRVLAPQVPSEGFR